MRHAIPQFAHEAVEGKLNDVTPESEAWQAAHEPEAKFAAWLDVNGKDVWVNAFFPQDVVNKYAEGDKQTCEDVLRTLHAIHDALDQTIMQVSAKVAMFESYSEMQES